MKSPIHKVIGNYNNKIYEKKDDIIEGLVNHLDNPVLFYQSIKYCINNNEKIFIDV